jgi:hypothetical protein
VLGKHQTPCLASKRCEGEGGHRTALEVGLSRVTKDEAFLSFRVRHPRGVKTPQFAACGSAVGLAHRFSPGKFVVRVRVG